MLLQLIITLIFSLLVKQGGILNPGAGKTRDFPTDSWCVTHPCKGVFSLY